MARWPCLHCDQRFEGEARNVYLQIYDGDKKLSLRYAVCPSSVDAILSEWWPKALVRDAYGRWVDADPNKEPESAYEALEGPRLAPSRLNGSR